MKKILLTFLPMLFGVFNALAASSGSCGTNLTWTLDDDGVLTISGSGDMSSRAFFKNTEIQTVIIEDGVTSVGFYAFRGCTSIEEVSLPGSIVSVDENAFYGCSALTSINLPDGVESIGDYAFYGCTQLTDIDIPGSVTSLGIYVFNGCSKLSNVSIQEGVTAISNAMFQDCASLGSLLVPNSVASIGNFAFKNCSSLAEITISENVASIGNFAFSGCSNLKKIVSYNAEVPVCGRDDAFSDVDSSIPVYVPQNSISAYKAAVGWEYFTNYKAVESISPIEETRADDTDIKVTAANGTIECSTRSFTIQNLIGQDVTAQNGSLYGIYFVNFGDKVIKLKVSK